MTLSASPAQVLQVRRVFRWVNRFMVGMWRLGLGSWLNIWPAVIGRIMVIKHRGRRSGQARYNPVNYAVVDGDVYCTAGFGAVSDWYRNILAEPRVEVWLPDGWWTAAAEDVSAIPERLTILRQVLIDSGFAARAAGIDPVRVTDEQLARLAADYRLVRLRREAARTGAGGPGDLAWLWPAATMTLAWLLLRRRPARRSKGKRA